MAEIDDAADSPPSDADMTGMTDSDIADSPNTGPHWPTVVFTVLIAITPAMPHVSLAGSPLDVTDLPTLAAAVVGLYAALRYRRWRQWHHLSLRRAPEVYALAAIVPFTFIAAVHAGSFHSLAAGPARWTLNAVIVGLAYVLLRSRDDAMRMLKALSVVAAAEAAFGLVAYGLRWTGPGGFIGISPTGGKIGGVPVFGRITGTTGMAATFIAGFFALALPIAVGLAMGAMRGKRWPWAICAVIIFFGLVFTLSRVPIGLATLAVVVLLLTATRVRVWLPIVVAGAIVFLATPLRARMTNFQTDRIPLWEMGWRVFTDHWFFGVGPDNYIASLARYQTPNESVIDITPHNSLLYVAAESGLFAALALGVAIALTFRFLRTRQPLVLGPMLGLAAFMVNAMTTNLYSIPSVAITAWMIAPCVALVIQRRHASERAAPSPSDSATS